MYPPLRIRNLKQTFIPPLNNFFFINSLYIINPTNILSLTNTVTIIFVKV